MVSMEPLHIAQVILTYQGKHCSRDVMCVESEVYQNPATGVLSVMTACPKCGPTNKKPVRIPGERKQITYDAKRGLFVEKWTCPWEEDNSQSVQRGAVNLIASKSCGASFEFAGFVIRDA